MQSPKDGRGARKRLASIGGIAGKLFHVKHRESGLPPPETHVFKSGGQIRWRDTRRQIPEAGRLNQAPQSSSTIVAAFSAIIRVGALVLPEVIDGITEASAIRKPATP